MSTEFKHGDPCKTCGQPMRDKLYTAAQAPGTVCYGAQGYCYTCRKHHIRANGFISDPDRTLRNLTKSANPHPLNEYHQQHQLPARPEGLDYQELRLRTAIEEQMIERHRRGIPAGGLLPEQHLAGAAR